ncbi:7-hydroxymethyl chlorophyll a reductase, chloroplastic-like [Glycine soja]|uniref:7-hydroxymethyl chlorophyll a reductase, chloroplastic-like n=1 Tax=Glycine soja TaxID=3848 RepID=UPI001039049A|nr:7-hydroxymethyl chlorophyll a reductase, chloroplastic-like [Glycine soja]
MNQIKICLPILNQVGGGTRMTGRALRPMCSMYGGALISWSSKKEDPVALSTYEAEYIAASLGACQGLWLRKMLKEMKIQKKEPVCLLIDNKSAISLAKNLVNYGNNKHIDTRYHFIRDKVNKGKIKLIYSKSKDNLADLLTKPLKKAKFEELRKFILFIGAQWTGIVTTIAIEMLKSGMVEAVICVQSDPDDKFSPRLVLARTPEEVLAAKGVKPTLSPNLNTLALVEAAGVKRLLFCVVGCQVQALRSVEHHLNLDKLYIGCIKVFSGSTVDNGTREGLDKFLKAASQSPETVLHYEFMQDYKVHLKHLDGHLKQVPYFCLPTNDLVDVIAPSCYSCFDYTNALVDLVVGYMGVPKHSGIGMTQHPQYVTVRNKRGREMLSLIEKLLEITPTISTGNRRPFVMETVKADDEAKLGRGPSQPAPKFIGSLLAFILNLVGPKGLEFARYSLDYHTIHNYLHVNRMWGKERADKHMPTYAKKIVDSYNQNGQIEKMLSNK